MAEEADEPNTLLITHLWKAATERDGPSVHKGIGIGLGWVALPTPWKVNVLI